MLTPNTFGTMEQGHYFSLEPGIYSKEILGACRIKRDAYLGSEGITFTDEYSCEL